jgi:hypothetical protein
MSGQSAALSLKEARAMQERVQASGSQAKGCGSGGGKKPHENQKTDHAGKNNK